MDISRDRRRGQLGLVTAGPSLFSGPPGARVRRMHIPGFPQHCGTHKLQQRRQQSVPKCRGSWFPAARPRKLYPDGREPWKATRILRLIPQDLQLLMPAPRRRGGLSQAAGTRRKGGRPLAGTAAPLHRKRCLDLSPSLKTLCWKGFFPFQSRDIFGKKSPILSRCLLEGI